MDVTVVCCGAFLAFDWFRADEVRTSDGLFGIGEVFIEECGSELFIGPVMPKNKTK